MLEERVRLVERRDSDPPISIGRKLGYSIGAVPKSCVAQIVSTYYTPYLLDVAQLPPVYVSVITFFAYFLDAFAEPFTGYAISRTNTRFGKFRPWILATTPIMLVLYIMLWYIPNGSNAFKLGFYIIVYSLYSIVHTMYLVPFATIVVTMTNSQTERDLIVAYRMTFDNFGTIIGLLAHALVLTVTNPDKTCTTNSECYIEWQQHACALSSYIMGGFVLVGGVVAALCSRERHQLHADCWPLKDLIRSCVKVVRFRPFAYMLVWFNCISTAFTLFLGNYALYYKYVFRQEKIFPFLILVIHTVAFLVVPVWQLCVNRLGKQTTLTIGILPVMFLVWLHLYLKYNFGVMLSLSILIGAINGNRALVPTSMFLDVMSAYSIEYGYGKETLFYSTNGFVNKIIGGLVMGFTTLVLQFAHYNSSATEQSASVILTLRLIVAACPILFLLLGVIFLWEYPLTEIRRKLLRERIKQSLSGISKSTIYGSTLLEKENLQSAGNAI